MDEKRLSRGNIDVKVQCHSGCTVRCMYSHLPDIFSNVQKTDFILLHIGSNDCTRKTGKTSDKVLYEIKQLVKYISRRLPCTKVIISLPIIRTDCSVAYHVQKHLYLKLKRQYYPYLDHPNINDFTKVKFQLQFL